MEKNTEYKMTTGIYTPLQISYVYCFLWSYFKIMYKELIKK